MKMLPSDPDIQTIYARIKSGDLDLQPNFQRGEVWTTAKKRKLIDSILREWHVPPIHVVVAAQGKQEVLDGQQRLTAIRDFIEGHLTVDGNAEPFDRDISSLADLLYDDLPSEVKRRFDQFTIRVFRLTDYRPGEPGELFFRLNQMTYLTAAEQRNAFFGPVREQVRALVEIMESSPSSIGFSNRRMAYDDVIAKFLCTLESGTLSVKLGAAEISTRFRSSSAFSQKDLTLAESSIKFFMASIDEISFRTRFNKATLFTWLMFAMHFVRAKEPSDQLAGFVSDFEQQRSKENEAVQDFRRSQLTTFSSTTERSLLRIFSDRSSSRVSDVSSVIFRDLILWIFFAEIAEQKIKKIVGPEKSRMLNAVRIELRNRKQEPTGDTLERFTDAHVWGSIR
jgi:hypothetical protein